METPCKHRIRPVIGGKDPWWKKGILSVTRRDLGGVLPVRLEALELVG